MKQRRPVLAALAAALLFACLGSPAMAQWKWRDANGRITVSDLPPPREVSQKDILQRPEPSVPARAPAPEAAASAALPAPVVVDEELQSRKRAAEQELAARAKLDAERLAEQKRQNCRNARNHLAALDSGQRIARVNSQGGREILDDHQRAEEARRAREVIASDCV